MVATLCCKLDVCSCLTTYVSCCKIWVVVDCIIQIGSVDTAASIGGHLNIVELNTVVARFLTSYLVIREHRC